MIDAYQKLRMPVASIYCNVILFHNSHEVEPLNKECKAAIQMLSLS